MIHVQEKGWMDDSGCVKWINEVWAHQSGTMLKLKSLLMWDMFKSHLMDTTKKALKSKKNRYGSDSRWINICTATLDVSLNKSFKDSMHTKWND